MKTKPDFSIDPDTLTQMDESMRILTLVKGTLADGSKHYAYVSIPPSRYQAFKEAETKGNYNLAAYGTILSHGKGSEPSADVKKRMEKDYGANHHFEKDLHELTKRMQMAMKET
jgi:hypothetical protein